MNKGGSTEAEGLRVTMTNAHHSVELRRGGRHDRLHRRACRARCHARERLQDLLRRRHVRVRRHGADRRALRARRRDAPDRRLLHDGAARGRQGRGAARREAGHRDATTARSRSSPARRTGCARSWPSAASATSSSSTPSPAAPSNDLLAGRMRPRCGRVGHLGRVEVPGGRAPSCRGRAAMSARSRPRATRT